MKISTLTFITTLCFTFSAAAASLEMPVYVKFKGTPLDKNPISGYVVFGALPDGSAAQEKVGPTLVRFYERSVLFAPSGVDDFYAAMEIDCKAGTVQVLGMGSVARITTLDEPPPPNKVKDEHPKNWPIYRRVCSAAGLQPSW